MNLKSLSGIFFANGVKTVYSKELSPNDNSKNQVYLGGSFEVLNILPVTEIKTEEAGDWERERFKATLSFAWINEDGNIYPAPKSQLILYPKYPEVRFSGFLIKCEKPPSLLMTQRLASRLLFLGVSENGSVLGYVAAPDSEIVREFNSLNIQETEGIFKILEIAEETNSREALFSELYRIHQLDWIRSKSLTKVGVVPCEAPQCGGYTLEAELGIVRNGFAEPDFMGWEIKNFGVSNFDKLGSTAVTLFTPEPTGGLYKTSGASAFLLKYGYKDKQGREDRINFGGVHKIGIRHPSTNLEMQLIGFDTQSGKIRNSNGSISLIDPTGVQAASWTFASMLLHWNRKHNQACYVPSIVSKEGDRKYKYGNRVMLGNGTDFQFFLQQMAAGNIYYDPGIKMENVTTKPKIKKRNQFRINSKYLGNLYKKSQIIELP